ncbi:TPA: glycosyltransferase family 4 protein [Streptococcus suis]|nr:glycosyltransferase family 4 protein [Streptococcus suis]HEM5219132.1 glycosyltransferase family 4 protein [Streptococcus suis]HEM6222657.1 glycosyltransferase family 4 protein [Streptococcus suis]
MMKILYVTTISNTLNAFLVSHIQELVNAGHKVDIACKVEKPLSDALLENTRNFYELEFNRSPRKNNFLRLIKQVRQLVCQEEYDIVHTHTPIASAVVRLACKGIEKTRVFYTAHGFHFLKGGPLFSWLIYYPIEKILSRYTDTLITINKEDYSIAKKKFKMKHLHLVPGVGVDLEKFYPVSSDEKLAIKKQLGLETDKKYLICIGELNINKNQILLIKMMEILCKEREDIVLLLVGSGHLERQLQQLVNQLNLERYVRFLGYRNDIADLLKASDIALSSSKREGLPVNLIEAMATGLPLIVTNCRGNRDLVQNFQNGFVLERSEQKNFSRFVTSLLDKPNHHRRMYKNNLNLVSSYSISKIMSMMEKIYIVDK